MSQRANLQLVREPIVDKCKGCKRAMGDGFCYVYISPGVKWRFGNCPMATHLEAASISAAKKKRIGQMKQKKQPELSKQQRKAYARVGMQGN